MPPSGTPVDGSSTRALAPRPDWRVTWLGHATAAIEIDGRRVLVDPLGRGRARKAGRVDAILCTHAHVDHLNRWTLRGLDRDTHLIVPHGAAPVVADLGFARISEVTPGDHLDVAGLDVVAVPTRHDAGRWRKRHAPIAAGYVVARGGVHVHHAGDVDASDHAIFDDLGKRFALDATLLPIGGMLPVWYYRMRQKALDRGVHIDPDAALAIAERLGARAMVPVHWGTVNLRLGRPSMAPRRLVDLAASRGLDRLVRVLAHGQAIGSMISDVVGHGADHAHHRHGQADDRAEDPVSADRGDLRPVTDRRA
jgi:L-ascorbate metabolism protein UlaG (beta-lactamase superfamily)